MFVDRELVFTGTLKDLGREMLLTEAQAGYRMRRRLIDPNFGRSPSQVGGGQTVIQELGRKPFPVLFGEADDDKELGHARVRQALHWDKRHPLSFTNSPKLYLHRTRCQVTSRSLRNYQFAEWQGKTKDDRDPKEREKPKDTHGADCVRYLCIGRPRFEQLMHASSDQLLEALY